MWIAAAFVLLISIGATVAQPGSGEAAVQPKKIMVLHSYGQNFQSWGTWSREIRNQLSRQSPWPLDIQEYSLVTARNGDAAAEAKFVEYLERALRSTTARFDRRSWRHPRLASSSNTGQTCFRQRRCCSRRSNMRRVDQSMLSEQDAVVGVRVRSSRSFRKHSAAVAGDEDHRGDNRKLASRAILGWRGATGTGSAA